MQDKQHQCGIFLQIHLLENGQVHLQHLLIIVNLTLRLVLSVLVTMYQLQQGLGALFTAQKEALLRNLTLDINTRITGIMIHLLMEKNLWIGEVSRHFRLILKEDGD